MSGLELVALPIPLIIPLIAAVSYLFRFDPELLARRSVDLDASFPSVEALEKFRRKKAAELGMGK